MRNLEKVITAVILLFVFFSASSMANIISVKIRSDNRNMIRFSNDFRFSHTGRISIAVSSVAVSSASVTLNISQPDPSRIGFFLLSDEAQYNQELKRNPDLCALDSEYIAVLFTFRDLSPPPHSYFNKSYPVTYPGAYSLHFANCNELSVVSMDIRTELYNTHDDGSTKDYLSAELTQLPSLYFKFSVIYLCFLVFWIIVCFKNQRYFHRMHLLMGMLLFVTFAYYACAAEYQHYIKVTGTPQGWDILFYIFQFIRNVLFSIMIVLLGAGLCFWKSYLHKKELLCLVIVIIFQVSANVYSIRITEFGPYMEDWEVWNENLYYLVPFCCIIIYVYIMCSAHAFIEDNKTVARETAIAMESFIAFKKICARYPARPDLLFMLVTLYIFLLLICILLPLLREETITLLFSMVMFYMFRPFALDDEDENCAGLLGHNGV